MTTPTIKMGFASRQTANSKFSHTTLTEPELVARVLAHWDEMKPTYRDYNEDTGVCDKHGLPLGGVIKVTVEPEGFFSGVCKLKDGDALSGIYEPRRKGEEPRKSVTVVGREKIPAQHVDIILYHADVLAEDDPSVFTHEWEIVSINASPEEGEIPISVGVLLHNHFGSTGGTSTGMTDAKLVAQLRESFAYWSDKAMAGGES